MKQRLNRFTCDHCEAEVISEDPPRGWVRLLSDARHGMRHRDNPPHIWAAPRASVQLPDDGYWCSPKCLSHYLEQMALRAIDRAALVTETER